MAGPTPAPVVPANPLAMAPPKPASPFDPNWMPGEYGMTPTRPDYAQAYDPKTMSLTDYLGGKYNSAGYDKFKSEAMRTGPSAWAKLAKMDQDTQAAFKRDQGAGESNAATAQAMDQLASRGGLSSGARERAATEGAKNHLAMSQDIGRQQTLNGMQIGMNDEQNRVQQLSQLPGMEQNQATMWEGAKQQDYANTIAENDRRNKYNSDIYGQQMSAWGANRQAQATERSGK